MFPKQNIPESQKTKDWAKHCVKAVSMMIGSSNVDKQQDQFCYNFWNGIFEDSDYNYLKKVGSFEYPAKVRYVPLLRPKGDLLRSIETKRPFNFRAFTTDNLSISKKEERKVSEVVDLIRTRAQEKQDGLIKNLSELQASQQQLAQQPDDFQAKTQLKEVTARLAELQKQQLISQQDIEKIDDYYKYKFKDFLEILTENGLNYMIHKYNIKDIFSDGFEDKIVTDKEVYYVDYDGSDEDPVIRRVNQLNFYYSGDDEATFIDECEWAAEERFMTSNQIIDEYRDFLSVEDLEKIKKRSYVYDTGNSDYSASAGYAGDSNYSVEGGAKGLYAGTNSLSNKIRVMSVFWQSPRQIRLKESPNKYNADLSFTKWMKEEDTVRTEKGEKEVIRYVNDVWEGVQIGADVYIKLRKKPYQIRSVDKVGKVGLPYIGRAYNGINKKPYSLIWAAKDIQVMYNLVHYHKELWLALSGVKGFIMDKSQIPDGMSAKEWVYQRKMGIGWIETVKENGQRSTFNQFQTYDDTVSPAIQYLINILDHLEKLASSVMGVSREAMGQTVGTDQVGTTRSAIQQSALVTEIKFWEHDQIKKRALSRLVNLCKLAWKDGKRGQYVVGNLGQQILNVPAGALSSADYEVFLSDSGKEQKIIEGLQGALTNEYNKGAIPVNLFAKAYSIDSIAELEHTLDKYVELAEQKAAAGQQSQKEFEAQKDKMAQETAMLVEKQRNEFKNLELQLGHARLDFDKEKFGKEQEFAYTQSASTKQTQDDKTKSDAQVELMYLNQQELESERNFSIAQEQLAIDHKDVDIKKSIKAKEQIKD